MRTFVSLLLCLTCLAPLAAADLTVDGGSAVVVAPGDSIVLEITGPAGAAAWLLLDLDDGPSLVLGQSVPLGFSPAAVLLELGTIPGSGSLVLPVTIPAGDAFAGLTVFGVAATNDGAGWSFSDGISVAVLGRDTPLAGNPLGAAPHFEYVRAINAGAPVSAAVDPSAHPQVIGVTADVYVVASKTPDQWQADPSLVDVSGDGADVFTFSAGSIAANTLQVDGGSLSFDAGLGFGVPYDLVVDLDRDGQLDPADLIDGHADEAGFYVVHDPVRPGPLDVTEALYSGGTWLGQNLFYPTDIASMGELPLVVVSHGNGHNYQWYDHIGEHLASYGFVVMSHQNNTVPGIQSASLTTLDNTDYFLGNLDIIEGGLLDGHVDGHNITWIGHSRGGEGVARAYDRLFDGINVMDHFTVDDVKLVSSIAPTDFLGTNGANPHDVDYHLWVGGADADVTGCANNDIAQSFHLLDRAVGKRMSISLHGVGHGDFHNSSGSVATGPCLVGKNDTHAIMKGYLLPLVLHHIQGNVPAEDFLWRQWESFQPIGAPVTDPCVVVDLQYLPGPDEVLTIDDFQDGLADLATASGGAAVSSDLLGRAEGQLNDPNTSFTDNAASFNGFTYARNTDWSAGAVFEWDGGVDRTLRYDFPGGSLDASGHDLLSFRACQITRDALTTAEVGDLTFTVTLEDRDGDSATIDVGVYGGGVEEPYQRGSCGSGFGWGNEFESLRIPLSAFTTDGTGVDLDDLAALTFTFGPGAGSAVGRLGLDDLVFTLD